MCTHPHYMIRLALCSDGVNNTAARYRRSRLPVFGPRNGLFGERYMSNESYHVGQLVDLSCERLPRLVASSAELERHTRGISSMLEAPSEESVRA